MTYYYSLIADKFYTQGEFAQVDNISFIYPNFPLLTQPWMITNTTYCTQENKLAAQCLNGLCQCPYVIPIKKNSLVELVFINFGEKLFMVISSINKS